MAVRVPVPSPPGVYDYGNGERHPDDPGPHLADCVDADTGEPLTNLSAIDTVAGTVTRVAFEPSGAVRLAPCGTQVLRVTERRRVAFVPKADVPTVVGGN